MRNWKCYLTEGSTINSNKLKKIINKYDLLNISDIKKNDKKDRAGNLLSTTYRISMDYPYDKYKSKEEFKSYVLDNSRTKLRFETKYNVHNYDEYKKYITELSKKVDIQLKNIVKDIKKLSKNEKIKIEFGISADGEASWLTIWK